MHATQSSAAQRRRQGCTMPRDNAPRRTVPCHAVQSSTILRFIGPLQIFAKISFYCCARGITTTGTRVGGPTARQVCTCLKVNSHQTGSGTYGASQRGAARRGTAPPSLSLNVLRHCIVGRRPPSPTGGAASLHRVAPSCTGSGVKERSA